MDHYSKFYAGMNLHMLMWFKCLFVCFNHSIVFFALFPLCMFF